MSSTADEPNRDEQTPPGERASSDRGDSPTERESPAEPESPADRDSPAEPESPAEQGLPTEQRPPRWWHRRRLLRGRVRPLLAAGIAGALLGVGGMAWQAQVGPFAPDEVCWGALTRDDLAPTFREPENVQVVEAPVLHSRRSLHGPTGSCQLTNSDGDEWAFTARVHQLDDGAGDHRKWAEEFLSARLTPLGGGLLGMASDNRAWLAIPDGCLGRPGDLDGPTVVDIAQGDPLIEEEPDTEERDGMARMVVKLANKVSAELGCTGTIADPVERLPKAARYIRTEKPDALCGVEGLALDEKPDSLRRSMITEGRGPVRTCDRVYSGSRPDQRMMTVEDSRLAGIFTRTALDEGDPLRSADGFGGIGPDRGIFQTRCASGRTVFLVQFNKRDERADMRTLFPRYVEAEAARLGCGPLKLEVPPPSGGGS